MIGALANPVGIQKSRRRQLGLIHAIIDITAACQSVIATGLLTKA